MKSSGGIFDISAKSKKLEELREKTLQAEFWSNGEEAQGVLRKISILEKSVKSVEIASRLSDDAQTLLDLAEEDEGEELGGEITQTLEEFNRSIEDLEFNRMLGGKEDLNNAIVSINPGAGGQHVNKTDSAIRITHIPTGLVVQCQNERSQHKNKATAMKMLKAKLYTRQLEEQENKKKEIESTKQEIGFGSQIRSYVFHPYNMVKDHRTGTETGNVQAVMNGKLDDFIKSYLLSKSEKK